ncbi:uncharacterized protein LOC129608405 [Condylostylus longicornis]|uniref:uncharacterized protein LOC129608405 n=1 Tax=Condylostylus longicornis TaxID=2530218 RepID=UPI00244E03DF|nr:uncharacterized protein LOC129608405 [Condylostylus longicornis]XP_055375867.1 uncharacterized protein LOC129608405 [Condylostylus longicornis]
MENSEVSSSALANSYITEFNEQFERSRRNKGPIDISLHRSLTLMISVPNADCYNPVTVPIVQFYINLHKLLSTSGLDEDTIWTCCSILQHASKNVESKNAIISKFRFFPLLSKILPKLNGKEKAEKLLKIMQTLSYGIIITWEEPYLSELVKTLLAFIYSEDDDLAQHSLSVLVNICHRNFPVVCTLMRVVNISELCQKTKKYGVLASKLILILQINDLAVQKDDVECLIKKCFIDFETAIKKSDVSLLQHIIHFVQEINELEEYRAIIVEFPGFEKDFENIIQVIENTCFKTSNDVCNENGIQYQEELFLSLTLEFLTLVLEISLHLMHAKQFVISSDTLHKIFELCQKWCDTPMPGTKALLLMKSLVELVNDEVLSTMLEKFENLPKIIASTENNENSSEYATALQKLLISLLKRKNVESILFSLITDSYFNKILSPILSGKRNENFSMCSAADLSKYLYCFLILIEFSKIAESTWKRKVNDFFQLHQMKYILAKGILSENPDVTKLLFEISKTDSFPVDEVAKLVSELNKSSSNKNILKASFNSTNFDAFFERNRLILSKDCEHKLNITLEKFSNRRLEYENTATSELIELYTYKNNMIESKVFNLEKNLGDANQIITDLNHEISLQTAQLSKYTNINYQMNLKQERLVSENKDLKKQRDIFKDTADDLGKKFKEKSESLKRHMKAHDVRYAEKVNEINKMQKELNNLENERDSFAQKIKTLTTESETYVSKIDSLKKSISLLEAKCEQNETNIMEKDKNITKLNKTIDDLKKSQIMQENIIKSLESQIKEKNENIKQLEAEINEVEDMRKTVMSLMESKKPKRKA